MARVLISGASGLIGRALIPALESRGSEVVRLVRHTPANNREIQWDPTQAVSPRTVSGFDTVIHLSGENVAGRWTQAKKQRIRDSRVITTRNFAEALARADSPPKIFLCASAIGYYGNRGDELLTEESPGGEGFLASTCREWEEATEPATRAGIRVVNLRIGIVLSRHGGALKQMLLPFRLGLGGRIGSGRQWLSWIHVDDLIAAVLHTLDSSVYVVECQSPSPEPLVAPPFPRSVRESGNSDFTQPSSTSGERRAPSPGLLNRTVNLVAPNPVTNAEFTKTLAGILRRPAIFTIPATAARLAFGELADEGLLASARVIPQRLLDAGFQFRFPELESAVEEALKTGT
jgi:uncharacterized protein